MDGALFASTGLHMNYVTSVDFYQAKNEKDFLVSGSKDETLKVWTLGQGEGNDSVGEVKYIRDLEGYDNAVTALSFDPNGQYVVSGSKDNIVRVWDVAMLTGNG